jgi:quercetin dioxygenase-like cupin family protein
MPARKLDGKHTYLRSHKIAGRAVSTNVDEEGAKLRERAKAARSGRAGKTLIKQGPLRLTISALNKGIELTTHEVEGPMSVQVLRGRVRFDSEAGSLEAKQGGIVSFDAGVRHSAHALADSTLLITASIP